MQHKIKSTNAHSKMKHFSRGNITENKMSKYYFPKKDLMSNLV